MTAQLGRAHTDLMASRSECERLAQHLSLVQDQAKTSQKQYRDFKCVMPPFFLLVIAGCKDHLRASETHLMSVDSLVLDHSSRIRPVAV